MTSNNPKNTQKNSKSGSSKAVANPNTSGSKGFWLALGALVIIGALVIGLIVYNGRGAQAERIAENTESVEGVEMDFSDNTITLSGEGKEGKEVRIFEDFSCSYCAELSTKTDKDMLEKIKDGTYKVEIHPMVFQDGVGDSYQPGHSTRALAATLSLADHGDLTAYWNLRKFLMENQQQAYNQYDMDGLADLARDYGASKAAVEDIREGKHTEMAKQVSEANETWLVDNTGELSSPRVLIDGKEVDSDKLFNWVKEYDK